MRYLKLIVALGAIALLAGGASAVTYTIEHAHTQGFTATVSFDSGIHYTSGVWLGRFIMDPVKDDLPAIYPIYTIPNLGSPPHSHNGFFSYCLEPLQPIEMSSYVFSIGSLAGTDGISASEADLIRELFGRYDPLLRNDPTGPYTGGTFRTAAAALQLAVWKINLDAATETLGSWDFTSGLMRVGSTGVTIESGASAKADAVALLMLNSLDGTGPMACGLEGLRNDSKQDLLIQGIPEPVTMAGLMLGIGGLVTYVRKRRMAA